MASIRRQIDRMARDLSASRVELLHLLPVDATDRERHWKESASAPGLLGPDVLAERWAIADHLLARWFEWDSWVGRWGSYFGQEEEALPGRWHLLREQWSDVAPRLLNGGELRRTILRERRVGEVQADDLPSERDAGDGVRRLFHLIVERDRLHRLESTSREPLDQSDDLFARAWDRDMAALVRTTASLTDGEKARLYGHIRNYRHTMLLVSWLDSGWLSRFARQIWETPNMRHRNWVETVVDELCSGSGDEVGMHPDDYPEIGQVVTRIADAINELGYDDFLEDVRSADFRPGPGTPLGDEGINIIPGPGTGRCCSLLVALSKGGGSKGALSFEKIMRRVKTHLIDCAGVTVSVLFLCDSWDSRDFAEKHFDELAAHYRRDVRFVFLQVGVPRTMLAPVALDLAQPNP